MPFVSRTSLVASCLVALAGCGPGGPQLSFRPSNLPADLALSVGDDLVFNGERCGPRAEVDTDSGEIRCYKPSQFAPTFEVTVLKSVVQSDGSEVTVFVGRNVRIEPDTEVQLRGQRPAVLVALETMRIAGRITAQDSIYSYVGHAGGAGEPSGSRVDGLGQGGGKPGASDGAGAGGASHCGLGGKGGDDTNPAGTGGAPGASYGTAELVPLRGGSSGGKNGNHSGAGGGAVQLVAGNSLEVTAEGKINMGGLGGGWFGNGGGSGGAILLESPTVTVAGVLAANGGGGGGGAAAGGQDGANAAASATAALGGAGGASGTPGGAGSAGGDINAAGADATGGQAGGGGGGAGRIRINTSSGSATLSGTLSPQPGTSCATEGTLATK